MDTSFCQASTPGIPLDIIPESQRDTYIASQSAPAQAWLKNATCRRQTILKILGTEGSLVRVALVQKKEDPLTLFATAATALPAGSFYCDTIPENFPLNEAFIGWALGQYQFNRFKTKNCQEDRPLLAWHAKVDQSFVTHTVKAISFARDLITTPASHLGPQELCQAIRDLLKPYSPKVRLVSGDDLLKKGYPAIHTVGRASDRPPQFLDISWGKPSNPKLALVGKGVCFDSGGLDLKPSSNMLYMKKDMGGAAVVAALAYLLMAHDVPVSGRLFIAAVENSVSSNAYRPLDVITMRNGTTVEVGNTDAEGRLILADCLSEAAEWKPDLIIDCATLTGAARVALGTELPAVFSQPEALSFELTALGKPLYDPVWPMPLFEPYHSQLKSPVSDMCSTSSSAYGGAIAAALFLQHFVGDTIPWLHVDMMAWNTKSSAGKPEGGEAQALRTLFAFLKKRYV